MKYEKSAGIIIYFTEDKFSVSQNPKTKQQGFSDLDKEPKFLLLKYTNYWGFAKGIIEGNESEQETAIRELEEETGIKNVKIIPGFKYEQEWFYRLNNENVKKKATFFLAKITKEEAEKVKISFEHEEFAWLTFSEAIEKMKIKNNKEMLKKAYEFIEEYERQKKLV